MGKKRILTKQKDTYYCSIMMNTAYHDKNSIKIQEELERRILHGLSDEWEAALWVLNRSYSFMMKKPMFSIRDLNEKLGYWILEKREICLSRDLVINHSWDAVVEVLLHEIAHQFASEALHAYHESPHGRSFKKACQLLRANPKASGRYRPLDERVANSSLSVDDKILLRVKKLMALAESCNRHEAEAAMAKAHELIAKYNIDLLAYNKNRDFSSVFLGKPALRHYREAYHLANLLQDFYFVSGIWVSTYVLEKGKMGRVLEISGTIQNIKIASYIYDFIRHYIDAKWRDYNKTKRLNRFRKTDFAVGIIEGFQSKLESKNKKNKTAKKNSALIKIEDPLLDQYMKHRYPRLTSFSRGISSWDDNVWKDGMGIGKKMVISKGIRQKENKSIYLIEGK